MPRWMQSLTTAWRLLDVNALACTRAWCSLCNNSTLHLKLRNDEIAVRCLHCRAGAPSRSIVQVLRQYCPDLAGKQVYELSARGPLCRFLKASGCTLTLSEYAGSQRPGSNVCQQDVQALTFAAASFDVCTSTDVFEHVPDDRKGFRELWRVLKPGGLLIFTVPLSAEDTTVERTMQDAQGKVYHLLPAEYHGDPLSSDGRILAWRNYGRDICGRLLEAGFTEAQLTTPEGTFAWDYKRQVVVACKGMNQ